MSYMHDPDYADFAQKIAKSSTFSADLVRGQIGVLRANARVLKQQSQSAPHLSEFINALDAIYTKLQDVEGGDDMRSALHTLIHELKAPSAGLGGPLPPEV